VVEMVYQTVLFRTCGGLTWRFQTKMNNEGGVRCYMGRPEGACQCSYTGIEAEGHALGVTCDSLGYWKESLERVVRVHKEPVILGRLVGSKMGLSL